MFDKPFHIGGDCLLGANQYVDGYCFVMEQATPCQIGRFTNAGDLGGRTKERVGDLAGDHIGFIATGHGNQHVGVVSPGLAQNCGKRTPPHHSANIQPITQLTQARVVGIDNGDVVGFTCQLGGQAATHLTCAENDDLHSADVPLSCAV